MTELKPCPACGASRGLYVLYDEHDMEWFVFCDNCKTSICNEHNDKREDAVRTWNRRAELTCLAKPYEVDGETGFYDCIECECGEVNDVSARYCNGCGGLIEVVYE